MDRKIFFDRVRKYPFGGSLTLEQVEGMNAILDEYARRSLNDLRWLAYPLATTYHEVAGTMQPIEEYGKGRGRSYGVINATTGKAYYGRGLVQLTWVDNYRRMGEILGLPLVEKPELALRMDVAVKIMFEGMTRGVFTGHKLAEYFNTTKDDPVGARRIINGTDRADLVAAYHWHFLAALKDATAKATEPKPAPVKPTVPRDKTTAAVAAGGGLAALIGALGAWLGWW